MIVGILGMVANPASGKDVRRLVARASVFDNQEKQAIVSRALVGAYAAGAREIAYLDDAHGIVAGALRDHAGFHAATLGATRTGTPLDTISAARALRDMDSSVVITLGGDGTNRAFAIGWSDAPLIPLSTGTNNVFPRLLEGTVAGAAAGLIVANRIGIDEVADQQKLIRVEIEGERDDIALIDAVLSRERFVGARALLAPEMLDTALLTRADPTAVGITAIGGLLMPVSSDDERGLVMKFMGARNRDRQPIAGDRATAGGTVRAPIAPGLYRPVTVARYRTVRPDERIEVEGPGVLAFDGERDRTLRAGQAAHLFLEHSGPLVVDVGKTLKLAAARGLFREGLNSSIEQH